MNKFTRWIKRTKLYIDTGSVERASVMFLLFDINGTLNECRGLLREDLGAANAMYVRELLDRLAQRVDTFAERYEQTVEAGI